MSISISGNGTFTGVSTSYSFDQSVSIGGTLTYEDVTNIDSVGVVTARSGVYFGSPGSGTQVDGNSTGIGIGTDNPTEPLTVQCATDQGLLLQSYNTTSGAVDTGPYIYGNFNDGATNRGAGSIAFLKENGTSGNYDSYMVFRTRANGESPTERLRIDSQGRMGLGTQSPSDVLHVSTSANSAGGISVINTNNAQASAIGQVFIQSGNNAYAQLKMQTDTIISSIRNNGDGSLAILQGTTERARIDSSGEILINSTTSRTNVANLEPRIQIEGINNDTSTLAIISNNTSDGTAAQVHLCKSSSGTVGSNGAVVNNEVLGRVSFDGSDGTNFKTAAQIICTVEGTVASGQVPAMLRFYTTNLGNSSPNEKFRIQEDGAVIAGQNGQWGSGSKSFYIDNASDQQTLRISNSDTGSSPYQLIGFYRNRASTPIATITTDGSIVTYNTSSDYRLKENVVDLNGAIDRIKQLAPKQFNWIVDESNTPVDGFLAHEVQEIVPEAITGAKDEVEVWKEGEQLPDGVSVGDNKLDEDGNTIPVYQGIDQSKLVPLLTAALQEALAKIETLEQRLTDAGL
jgi:hypothetical protein